MVLTSSGKSAYSSIRDFPLFLYEVYTQCLDLIESYDRNHSKSNLLLNRANLLFLQVNGSEKQCRFGSFENHAEAQAVVQLVQKASKRLQGQWQSADRIRVITFYAAQVLLIKNYLRRCGMSDVVVATVGMLQMLDVDFCVFYFSRISNLCDP